MGVLLPDIHEDFFSEALSGIEIAGIKNNYNILFGQSYDDQEKVIKVVEAMKRQRVDGLIISLSKQTQKYEHLLSLEKFDLPVVYFDRVPPYNANKIYCNLYKGTVELVGWLFSKGYKSIAFINGPDRLQSSKERMNGYIEGVSKKN